MIRGAERSVRQRCARLCFQEFHEYQVRILKRQAAWPAPAKLGRVQSPTPSQGSAQLMHLLPRTENSMVALGLK